MYRRNDYRVLMSVVLSATLISVGAQAATRVLEQKDLFRMQWVTDPQIRKDGAQIAYGRMANDIMTDRQSQSLWLIDTATGAQTPLASGPGLTHRRAGRRMGRGLRICRPGRTGARRS